MKEDSEKDELKRQEILIAKTFNFYDYMLFQRLAFHSGNQIYGLIFNGLKKLYDRVGSYYFPILKRVNWPWNSTVSC